MPNTNCLEHIQCPKCNHEGPFWITASTTALVHDDGEEEYGDLEWDNNSNIRCQACSHSGLVSGFTAEPPEHKAYREAAREQYGREGEIEIDDDAEVSHSHDHSPIDGAVDEGTYVAAWVWVAKPEAAE